MQAKLPKQRTLDDRIRAAYSAARDEARTPADGEAGLRTLVGELGHLTRELAFCCHAATNRVRVSEGGQNA